MSDLEIINIEDLSPAMILTDNIKDEDGKIILSKNEALSEMSYRKIKKNGIEYVKILKDYDKSLDSFSSMYKQKILKNTEYVEFVKNYTKGVDIIKRQFFSISKLNKIDTDLLYGIVTNILDNIEYKNQVFSYMCHLEDDTFHTYTHNLNVGIIAYMFGIWLGMEKEELKNITLTGLLHDIGKIKLDVNILNKKESLTKDEFEYIKTHSYLGYELLENLDISDDIKYGVLMHHEKVDASGYPIGIKGDRIYKTAKIIAICDMYEAMTSYRAYRKKLSPFEAIEKFEQSVYEFLDADLLLAFLKNIAYVYVGCDVVLTNDEIGEVVFINPKNITRPIVKIGDDMIDLSKNQNLDISYII